MYDKLPDIEDWGQYACENFATKLPSENVEGFIDHIELMANDFVYNDDKGINVFEFDNSIKEELTRLLSVFGMICVLEFIKNLAKVRGEEEE